jgi:hypothetical protein
VRAFVLLSVLFGALTALVLAVGGTAAPGPCLPGDTLVSIKNTAFAPQSITVTPGTTVCWTNDDPFEHTVTSDTPGQFDSGSLSPAESFRNTFASAGTFDYDCSIPGHVMPGTVTVSGAPSPPPPGPPPPGPPPPGPPPPGPPPPSPPPAPPGPPPPAAARPLQVSAVRIAVERGRVVARARINMRAVARLSLIRDKRIRRSVRKQWLAGRNAIRVVVPPRARGRWTAELRVGTMRFRRTIRFG